MTGGGEVGGGRGSNDDFGAFLDKMEGEKRLAHVATVVTDPRRSQVTFLMVAIGCFVVLEVFGMVLPIVTVKTAP